MYYWQTAGSDLSQFGFLVLAGGFAFLYLLNIIFVVVQQISLRDDKRLPNWLAGTLNTCVYRSLRLIGLLTTNKVTNLLFCKLFAFPALSVQLDHTHRLRAFYAFGFCAFISSLAVLVGTALMLASSGIAYDQLSMAKADVIILSIL